MPSASNPSSPRSETGSIPPLPKGKIDGFKGNGWKGLNGKGNGNSKGWIGNGWKGLNGNGMKGNGWKGLIGNGMKGNGMNGNGWKGLNGNGWKRGGSFLCGTRWIEGGWNGRSGRGGEGPVWIDGKGSPHQGRHTKVGWTGWTIQERKTHDHGGNGSRPCTRRKDGWMDGWMKGDVEPYPGTHAHPGNQRTLGSGKGNPSGGGRGTTNRVDPTRGSTRRPSRVPSRPTSRRVSLHEGGVRKGRTRAQVHECAPARTNKAFRSTSV
eukprot:scaffold2848_cov352-Pavlova_lutheri.AAC.9